MRSTRSGASFSPYDTVPIYCARQLDFSALLRQSTALEPDGTEDDDEDGPPPACNDASIEGHANDRDGPSNPKRPHLERGGKTASSPGPSTSTQEEASATSRPHCIRRKKRAALKEQQGHVPREKTYAKYARSAPAIETPLVSANLPAMKGAYAAKNAKQKPGDKKIWSVDELMEDGISYVQWDGCQNKPLLDSTGTVIAVLVGQPPDESYRRAAGAAFNTIVREGSAARFQLKQTHHRRGHYPALNVGVTYAKGMGEPKTLDNHEHSAMVARLLADQDIGRLATFASAAFQFWAPNVYKYYKDHLDPLWIKMPHLRRNFPRSIYPSAAFNFGPNVWTYRHRDSLNCPFGWCAIQALGNFDPTQGGHIILWELGLVIEFPPGALVLIPSATITHSNVPVQEGDTRASFTQYCAGGLFRYVDNGFRTENEFQAEDAEGFEEVCKLKETRWKMGLGLLSKFDDIVDRN